MKDLIQLRALTESDIEKTLNWHCDPDIIDSYSGHPFLVNREMEKKWYEKVLYSNIPTSVFGIELIQERKLIGISLLKEINFINRSCEFAIYIGDVNEKGKGYSKEATLKTMYFAFNKLGLNRIYLKVLEKNEIARRLYKSVGFIQEGVLRKSIFKNGQFINEIYMSILKEEFLHE